MFGSNIKTELKNEFNLENYFETFTQIKCFVAPRAITGIIGGSTMEKK